MARTKVGHGAAMQRFKTERRRRVLRRFREAIVKMRNVNRLIGRGAPGTGGPREAAAAKLQLRANAADVAMRELLRAGDEEAIVQAFVDAKEAAHEAQARAALGEAHRKRVVQRHRQEAELLQNEVERASSAATLFSTEVTFRLRRFDRRATEIAERCRREVAGDEDDDDEADVDGNDGNDEADEDDDDDGNDEEDEDGNDNMDSDNNDE
jgi:hypothetical protein